MNNDHFTDMEEYPDIWVGEGIRKMKAYKCDLPYDKLVALRHQFWASLKNIPKYVFSAIRNACEFDASKLNFFIFIDIAEQILTENHLVALDGCMKTIVDMQTGEVYQIPNFCICEPTFVKKLEEDIVEEQKLNVYLIFTFSLKCMIFTIIKQR